MRTFCSDVCQLGVGIPLVLLFCFFRHIVLVNLCANVAGAWCQHIWSNILDFSVKVYLGEINIEISAL